MTDLSITKDQLESYDTSRKKKRILRRKAKLRIVILCKIYLLDLFVTADGSQSKISNLKIFFPAKTVIIIIAGT